MTGAVTPDAALIRTCRAPRERLLDLHERQPRRFPALLESAAHGTSLGRYDILFAEPQAALVRLADGRITDGHGRDVMAGSFLDELDRRFAAERISHAPGALPFAGGWLVFAAYELASEIEPHLILPSNPEGIDALALRIPAAIIYDRVTQQMHVVAEAAQGELLERLLADVEGDLAPEPRPELRLGVLHEEEAGRYLHAVARAKEYIAAGDVYQVNLSRAWRGSLQAQGARVATPAQVYRALRAANPAPFAASFVWEDLAILSSSPERLYQISDGEISTRPIAGTRPRSNLPGKDSAETARLIAHPKERAEHVMLIDLERNDLGRICQAGSVRVDEFMTLESYAHVHHIVSNVRGRLRTDVSPGQVLRAIFPGGTITGCPKFRCMQIIAELEQEGRGAYTGSLGYLNRDGSGDFNILIRTMTLRGGEIYFRAGAGIVADSDPQRELEETRAKARGLVRALGQLQ